MVKLTQAAKVHPKLMFVFGLSVGFLSCFIWNKLDEEAWRGVKHFAVSVRVEDLNLTESLQISRQATLQSACQGSLELCPATKHIKLARSVDLYSSIYKFSVCQIHKCGSTNWLRAMLIMEGVFVVKDLPRLNGTLKNPSLLELAQRNLRYDSNTDCTRIVQTWKEAYKIITVRNPFSRLVSAYNNKMVSSSPGYTWYFEKISKKICKKYKRRRHNPEDRNKKDVDASFEDFVNFLLDTSNSSPEKLNSHWQFYHDSCQPCVYKYDFIMKLETFRQDAEYLKKKLEISNEHAFALFEPEMYRSQTSQVKESFKKITKEKANKLYQMYEADFKMFGYERPAGLS